jgi:hypothetical protein
VAAKAAAIASEGFPAARRLLESVLRFWAKDCFRKAMKGASSTPNSAKRGAKFQRKTVEWTSGGGTKASGGRVKSGFRAAVELESDGEQAVVARAGPGGDAVGYLALHHEDGAVDVGIGGEFKQDRRSDVIRQVADDEQRLAGFWAAGAKSNCKTSWR